MAGCHHLFSNRIIQYTGFIALLNEHQIFNVSLRALDGAEIQSANLEAVGSSIAHGIVQHLAVGGRVTDNAVFAHFFAASLKLGLDQADDLAVLGKTSTLKNSIGSASWSRVTLRMFVRSILTTRSSVRRLHAS